MKILIIGKTGQLGSMLVQDAIASGHDVFAPDKIKLDINNEESFLENIRSFLPEVVINTAAFHNVPLCENEPMNAFRSNCVAVKNMAQISNDYNSWFISFSTDYVFEGDKKESYIESDPPQPLQMYGLSKLAGEYAALSYSKKAIIIRTCGLYGLKGASSKGGNFVDNRIKESNEKKILKISCDQTISPTYTGDLSKAVLKLVMHPEKEKGIYHLVNEGRCTWFEFTKEIFNILDLNIELIPVDRKGRTNNMKRPLFSALKNKKAAKLGIILPYWKEALKEYLNIKYEGSKSNKKNI